MDYAKEFDGLLLDESKSDGELLSIARDYIAELQNRLKSGMKILIKYWMPDFDTGWPGNCHISGKNWKWRELGSEEELAKRREAIEFAKTKKETLRWAVKFAEEPKKPSPSEFLSAVGEPLDDWKLDNRIYKGGIVFKEPSWNGFYPPVKED